MPTYSKTVYVEVEADDEDAADTLVCDALDVLAKDVRVLNVDLAGPIEEVEV